MAPDPTGLSTAAGLTVLSDAGCPLCRWAAGWLSSQEQLVPLEFVAANSAEARSRFPGIDHDRTLETMTVIGNDGSVYCDEKAWLMCLWALARYRQASYRLATPRMLRFTSRFVKAVGKYRPHDGEVCESGSCHTVSS